MLKKIKTKINGDTWIICLMDAEQFDLNFEGNKSAITMFDHNTKNYGIFFKEGEDFNRSTIVHEVLHAFFSYQHVGSTSMSLEDLEEIFCDQVGYKFDEITALSDRILRLLRRL